MLWVELYNPTFLPGPQNVTPFGDRVFTEVKALPLSSENETIGGVGNADIGHQYCWCPYKKFEHGDTNTGKMPHEHEDSHLQGQEGGLEHTLPSQPQKEPTDNMP